MDFIDIILACIIFLGIPALVVYLNAKRIKALRNEGKYPPRDGNSYTVENTHTDPKYYYLPENYWGSKDKVL